MSDIHFKVLYEIFQWELTRSELFGDGPYIYGHPLNIVIELENYGCLVLANRGTSSTFVQTIRPFTEEIYNQIIYMALKYDFN